MGYYTNLYGVDFDKLRAFCDPQNNAGLHKLAEALSERIDDIDARFESEIEEDDWPLTVDAIAEVITNKCISGDHNPLYGYALEIICHFVGEHLNEDELGSLEYQLYSSRFLNPRTPVPIPIDNDFPMISYLEPEEIQLELTDLEAADISENEDIAEDSETLRKALQYASSKGLGVVAFYY